MHLEKLELQGFKSFVHKTTLSFPQPKSGEKRGIAAIVGPNGSGKSNLSDAVRWVMGEQSMKTIRGKKSEDVIFSGTEKLARVGLAEVSLYLNNEDGQVPIDYKEVVITRRLYRNGESEYLINRKRTRLQDITLMLAQASAGQKTYSILGQGMVDAILSASPLERKEYIDEAAGTRPLQLKKEESLNKLDSAEDNLRQGEVLIQEIEPRLRSLTRQIKRLERREEIMTELRQLQQRYFGSQSYKLSQLLHTEEETLNKIRLERQQAEQVLHQLENSFLEMEKVTPAGERFEALQKRQQEFWQKRGELRDQIVSLKTSLAEAEVAKPRTSEPSRAVLLPIYQELEVVVEQLINVFNEPTEESFSRAKELLQQLNQHANNLKREIAGEAEVDREGLSELQEKISNLLQQEQVLNQQLNEVQSELKSFHDKEAEKNKEVFALERQVRASREAVDIIVGKENEHKVNLARYTAEMESLQRTIVDDMEGVEVKYVAEEINSDEREQLKTQIDRLKNQVAQIGSIDDETRKEYEQTKERHEFLTSQSEDLRKGISDLKRIIKELDETIEHQFRDAFQKINVEFERFFKVLFNGGQAKLVQIKIPAITRQVEESDEEEGVGSEKDRVGIEIHATPPGKRLKSISMLSGGERALTSLALICAIMSNNPSPFVVLDEVDAALDEANSQRFASIIDQLSHQTQFVVITHNRATMHQANILYGVTMGDDGASKLLSLKLEQISGED
jgi:chromosome segregation protein